MKFILDDVALKELASNLAANGWSGSSEILVNLIALGQEESSLRFMLANWRWGDESKDFVLSLISCARKRQASVRVLNEDLIHPGPRVQMVLSAGGYMLLSVKNSREVEVSVRNGAGDYSSRIFRVKSAKRIA